MNTRRQFIERGGFSFFSMLLLPLPALSNDNEGFEGLLVSEQEGETILIRKGTTIVRIKVCRAQGSQSICFLSESILPGDLIPVHKHTKEDELIFIHRGSGIFTLGEKEYPVSEGAVAVIPKGVWHGLHNTGSDNLEMRFAYTPSGFEGFFREVGTPEGQPFIQRSEEEKIAIAKKWGMIRKV